MKINKIRQAGISGIKFMAVEKGQVLGRAFLYVIKNELHKEPFGLMEDIFVEENFRGKGIGRKLIQALIEEAKTRGCYKLIATSRHERINVHKLYERFGFKNYGREFRMDFKK